ncbi:MAG: hypothetical protein ACK5OB_17565 [Pirellula sp.]
MTKSILKVNTRPGQTYALIAVAITTVLAVVASGLKAMDDASFEWLHQLSLVAMLLAYGTFILFVWAAKFRPVKPLETSRRNDELLAWGLHPTQIVTIQAKTQPPLSAEDASQATQGDSGPETTELHPLGAMPTRYKHSVRVVRVRDANVDRNVLEILSHFPNVSVLDVQGCSVDPQVWHELVHLEHLKTLLACGAVPESEQRDLHLTLPEIEIVLQPTKVVAVASSPHRAMAS